MSDFIPAIYEKRHKYFLNFSNKFFGENFWNKVLEDDEFSCAWLCAFYTIVKSRCNTSNEETSEIIYNSLKKKFLKKESYDNFYQILKKNNFKLGFKGNIPFLNSKLKTAFDAFENLYLRYEIKMAERGKI